MTYTVKTITQKKKNQEKQFKKIYQKSTHMKSN